MATEDKKVHTFIVTDESLNCYGYWVSTAGIDLKDFKKNPVMLWNHNRTWRGTEDEVLPIGRWENLRVEGDKLLADAVFDLNDPFAAKIAQKVENGFLKAASIGLRPLGFSEAPELLKKGQQRATVTQSTLLEISVVDIPANKNAVALYDAKGEMLQLGEGGEGSPVPLISQNQSDNMDLKDTAKQLGLAETATQADIDAAIAKLKATANAAENQLADQRKKDRDGLIAAALSDGRLTNDAQRPVWESLFDKDFDSAKTALESMPKVKKLSDFVGGKPGESGEAKHEGMTFSELSKKDPKKLAVLKESDPAAFKALYKAEYGTDWKG